MIQRAGSVKQLFTKIYGLLISERFVLDFVWEYGQGISMWMTDVKDQMCC